MFIWVCHYCPCAPCSWSVGDRCFAQLFPVACQEKHFSRLPVKEHSLNTASKGILHKQEEEEQERVCFCLNVSRFTLQSSENHAPFFNNLHFCLATDTDRYAPRFLVKIKCSRIIVIIWKIRLKPHAFAWKGCREQVKMVQRSVNDDLWCKTQNQKNKDMGYNLAHISVTLTNTFLLKCSMWVSVGGLWERRDIQMGVEIPSGSLLQQVGKALKQEPCRH